jgi:hypothetical protein
MRDGNGVLDWDMLLSAQISVVTFSIETSVLGIHMKTDRSDLNIFNVINGLHIINVITVAHFDTRLASKFQ